MEKTEHRKNATPKKVSTAQSSVKDLAIYPQSKRTRTHQIQITQKAVKIKDALRSNNGRTLLGLSIIALIATIIFRNLFFTQEWPAGNDILGWISRVYIFGRDWRWLHLWRPYSFGFVEGINIMDLFFMLLYWLSRDPAATIKIFLFLSFLTAGFTMYAFTYHHVKQHLAALSAAMVYILNPWIFSQLTEGHVDLVFSYAFAPLVFLLLDRALDTGKYKDILLLTLGLSLLVTGFHPNSAVIYGFFIVAFILFYLIYPDRKKRVSMRVKRVAKISFLTGISMFLLTAFVVFPFVFNVKAYFLTKEYRYPLEEALAFNAGNITDAFTLKATEEGGYIFVVDIKTGFGVSDFPTQALLMILFLLAHASILVKRNRYTAFFLFATLISVFISKGVNPPLGDAFTWAWFNIPHFAVFRRPNRWEMMTAFSNAFFTAILASLLAVYIQRKKQKTDETGMQVEAKNLEDATIRKFSVSIDLYNKARKGLHKTLHYISISVLALIFLSGFISSTFFFSQGLMVYTPKKSYMTPYEWIASREGLYKVVTVNKSPNEWWNDFSGGTDFGFCRMLTDVGWGHDIGFDSSSIHDKPVLQDGGWENLSRAFVDHLRLQLAHHGLTADLLKILGAFNYRYIVIPAYASEEIRNFFTSQEGARIAYDADGTLILENQYCSPPVFVPNEQLMVMGGFEVFSTLCKIDSFNLSANALLSLHQSNIVDTAKAIVFCSCDQHDLAMTALKRMPNFILAAEYGVPSLNYTEYWAPTSFWRNLGKLVFGDNTLTTNGKNKITIPFSITSEDTYDVWLRIGYAPDRGKLQVYIDNELYSEIVPYAHYWSSLKWTKIASLPLKNGEHKITLSNDGSGYNDIDAITIVNPSILQTEIDATTETLQNFEGRLVYFFESEELFAQSSIAKENFVLKPYEGIMLQTENAVNNIAKEGTTTASSWQEDPETPFSAAQAVDGNFTTRWASNQFESPDPQWLQIEWTMPRELVGAQAFFEYAYAKDYAIQTWDAQSSTWVNQSVVTGNSLLRRLHIFENTVVTSKIRFYVSEFTRFGTVSMWEWECYERSTPINAKISIPRSGEYTLALRVASGPQYGTLYTQIGDKTFETSCFSTTEKAEWRELGAVYIDASEQTISMGGIGKIGLDGIAIYSLHDRESSLSIKELFKTSEAAPKVLSCEKIDPCTYKVHVNVSEPFLLVLSESYNPLWKAYINNQEIAALPTYSIVNGFLIEKTGEHYITIYFAGQNYADYGLKVSATTLIAILTLLVIPERTMEKAKILLKKTGKQLRQKMVYLKKIIPVYKKNCS